MDRRFFLGTIATIPLHILLHQDDQPGLEQPTKVKLVLDYDAPSRNEPWALVLPNGKIGHLHRVIVSSDTLFDNDGLVGRRKIYRGLVDIVDGQYQYMDAMRAWLMSDGTLMVERFLMRSTNHLDDGREVIVNTAGRWDKAVEWEPMSVGPKTYTFTLNKWRLTYLDGFGNTIYVENNK